jgi:hypothetical protein
MNSQLFSFPTKHDLKPVRSLKDVRTTYSDRLPAPQINVEQSAKVSRLLQRLFQSLTVLGSTSNLALTGRAASTTDHALHAQLHPNARQAEEAMHALRELRLTTSPVLTELSQSLTVLVLAADMIASGQLCGAEALSFYELLRRNADTTMRCLHQLYIIFGLDWPAAE